MTPLYAEIHRWAALPFEWGHADCMTVLCDWIHRVRGVDPARDVRGTYYDLLSCERATGYIRQPVETAARHFEGIAGLKRTGAPVRGDVGVLLLAGQGSARACGGLCLGETWCMKTEGAAGTTTMVPSQILAAWSVGYVDPA